MKIKSLFVVLSLFALAVSTGCKKKEEKKAEPAADTKPAEPAAAPADKPAEPAAAAEAPKADAAACEKVVAQQLELETDAEMKKTMEASKKMMVDACTQGMTGPQAECAGGAADKNAFAACLLK